MIFFFCVFLVSVTRAVRIRRVHVATHRKRKGRGQKRAGGERNDLSQPTGDIKVRRERGKKNEERGYCNEQPGAFVKKSVKKVGEESIHS